jgi:hypothetical protein
MKYIIAFSIMSAALAGNAAAQTSVYVNAYLSWPNVVATGTTDTHYAMAGQHTAYATVTARSPSGRSATVTGFQANLVSAISILPVNAEDGTYTATNEGKEWCPIGTCGTTMAWHTLKPQLRPSSTFRVLAGANRH